MPFGIPTREQGVVRTSPDIPNDNYEQKRVSLTGTWVGGTVRYLEPPDGYYWIVDSIVVEYASSIVESTRDVYYYVLDKWNRAVRVRLARVVKSSLMWISLTPGAGHTGYGVDTSSSHGSDPLHLTVQQNGTQQGFMTSLFEAGDVFNVHFFVREYKVV